MALRRVQPSSIQTPSKEDYEHLLVWISPFGGVRQWLFSHTDGGLEETFNSDTVESLSDVRSVPNEDRIEVEAITSTLTREDFEYVKSIFKSPRIYKVDKSGTKIPVGLMGGRLPKPNTLKNYTITVRFNYLEPDLLDV